MKKPVSIILITVVAVLFLSCGSTKEKAFDGDSVILPDADNFELDDDFSELDEDSDKPDEDFNDFDNDYDINSVENDDFDNDTFYEENDIDTASPFEPSEKCNSSDIILQFGTEKKDKGTGIVSDNKGNVYITGFTFGNFDGNINSGSADAFIMKLECVDSSCSKTWIKQWGTPSYDEVNAIVLDESGNIYVTGSTYGSMKENTNNGDIDFFVTKFDSNGIEQWTKQYGTVKKDVGNSIAVDTEGNIFVAGYTEGTIGLTANFGYQDAFLVKIERNGSIIWKKQFGSNLSDIGNSVTVNKNGNIFVAGYILGRSFTTCYGAYFSYSASTSNSFVAKYSGNGEIEWMKEIKLTYAMSVVADDSGKTYFAGSSIKYYPGFAFDATGDCFYNEDEIYLARINDEGITDWNKRLSSQVMTGGSESGTSISINSNRQIYMTGYVLRSVDGNDYGGGKDIFMAVIDDEGAKLCSKQWGTSSDDYGFSISSDNSGNIFITGSTEGSLTGTDSFGESDIFLIQTRINENFYKEPSS